MSGFRAACRACAIVFLALAPFVLSCGARTVPAAERSSSDAGRVDARPLDAGRRDAPGHDPGQPDSTVLPVDAGTPRVCRRDADCAGVCEADRRVASADLLPLPLVCGAGRPGGDAGAPCDTGDGCVRGICLVAGSCVAACVNDGDCAAGQWCANVYARTSPASLQPLSGCVDRVNPPPGVRTERIVLPGAISGGLDTIELGGFMGTSLHLMSPIPETPLVAERLITREATPEVLFDMFLLSLDGSPPRNPVASTGLPLGVLIPNGDRSIVTERGYELRVRGEARTDLALTSLYRSEPGSLLDVDVFYVGGGGLSAAGDMGPPPVATALFELDRIWGARGLSLGRVRQHDVAGRLRERLAIIEGQAGGGGLEWPELGELFALSAGVGRPSVSVFLVRIVDGALAVSGGAPGPQARHGTAGSGIALGVDVLGAPGLPPGLDMGRALSHELGHFFGLFHTSERNGFVLEPISDTPECRRTEDADGDGFLSADECVGLGAENLMYWAASGEELSPIQGRIAAHSMVLR